VANAVHDYAETVVAALGLAGDAQGTQLLAAADAIDLALDAPATLDVPLAQWKSATDGLRGELVAFLLAQIPVPLPLLTPSDGWTSSEGVRLDATLGPLSVHVECPPKQFPDPRSVSAPPITVGPLQPNSLAAHLEAGPVVGDGSVVVLPDGISGLLAMHLGVVEVAALASLRRVSGEGSFAAVFSAGFTPGLQFGFGFQLSRLGGVVGINRTIDTAALASRLRDGSAGEMLFPLDVGDSARRALAALEAVLPPHVGTSLAGPTMRLSWLEVAGVGFCSLDLGILIELPGPQRIVIVGIARAGIPPILKLRVDVDGVLDFVQQTLEVNASLVDSGLLDIFTIYGDLAFRQCWGPQAYTVLSVGGFYPGFRPEPASIPPLKRLGFHLDLPIPGITLRAEGYLAVTSNTIQLGGYFEAGIEAAGCGAHGFLSVDAIVQFTPFHMHADVSAGFEVEVFGLTFGGVRLDGTLDGPGPVTIHGRLTVETFLHDFHFDETFTFGSGDGPPAVPMARAAQVLADQEVRPALLRPIGGPDPDTVPARRPVPDGFALVSPRGGVGWQQKRVPLTIPVDRLDGAPLGAVQMVTASVPHQTSGLNDLFAPGQFITLSQAESLNRPAFDLLPAGVVSAGGADLPGPSASQPTQPHEFRKVRGELHLDLGLGSLFALEFPGIMLGMLAARDAAPVLASLGPLVTASSPPWVNSADGSVHPSATAAFQGARVSGDPGAFVVAASDLAKPVALVGL
jgi:hypothetical protein